MDSVKGDGAKSRLGRLRPVEPTDVWPHEAHYFTPWLAQPENLAILGDALGMGLEPQAQERAVGPFRADILCRDTATGAWVLIENQLERTDHTHLGQLMTYAAGLKAVTVVWIARKFTEEHRAALDWLNEITEDDFQFFGVEVEVWRIGESEPAPKFNIVSKPNDWSREVSGTATRIRDGQLTGAKQLQLEFWTAFREYVDGHPGRVKPIKPLPQNWMFMAIGRSEIRLSAVASTWNSVTKSYGSHELRAELIVDRRDHYAELEAHREALEKEFGSQLLWARFEGGKGAGRIYVRKEVDLNDRTRWAEYVRWLQENLDRFHGVFRDRVMALARGPVDQSQV